MASGLAGNVRIEDDRSGGAVIFSEALEKVSAQLAESIVRDGEGATKFIRINVHGAAEYGEARRLAFSIANSPLFKTAMYGGDPNWGRIMSAMGASGIDVTPGGVMVKIQGMPVFSKGAPHGANDEKLRELLKRKDVDVEVDLERGDASAAVLTCDFSPQYVVLNSA
jgi:glutamate N-acetyltransferase/amino-acid N-acetyltransferase